ncbi:MULTISPECIES: glycosyltransferase family A protein [Rhizobium]|uniref:glycosyltransferase family 2 protein n=1 Tax=Rhizobium TaxID=379 RepID=UPI001B342AF9|nr:MULTISPECIES: glycosyltransferase family A protein [Rhizobium]MBX4905815.1 glycosyltransferase family 2 protein [Rhizobium bangladeshense]MBX5212669.1 glycosyltransferase family 2 protein [Rhizobium sp. NLR9a]MBX5242938.1 glycosyltransferase family 2 protein [Rhizobium sp. NLR3b]MBX5249258.1 glycosyltransferase family 2 protein [Rhizobium sp. NLR4b]MBX5255402.1 glycosyltransferase family 2 protein [Rhizobium sp. NLR16b]
MLSCTEEDRRGTTNSDQTLVSVVIPAFNASIYIERTLRSALRQTYTVLEIIVVNDGSTDDTAKLVAQIAMSDSRIRLLSTPNRGVAAARNTGIEASSGRFVAFLDADDLWHRTKIEKQVNALNRLSSRWAAVYAQHCLINEDDEIIRPGTSHVARGYIYARHLSFKYVGNGSALLVRRNVALEIGGFDSSYAATGIGGCEDLDFELRLAARYCIEVVPEQLVGYRQHPGSMSSNHLRMGKGALEVVRRSLAANPHLPRYVVRSAIDATQKFAFWEFRQDRRTYLSLVTIGVILRIDPCYVVRLVLQKGLRGIQHCLRLRTSTAGGEDPPRRNRSKFDEQIVPSFLECTKETPRLRRHLTRLTAVDVILNQLFAPSERSLTRTKVE